MNFVLKLSDVIDQKIRKYNKSVKESVETPVVDILNIIKQEKDRYKTLDDKIKTRIKRNKFLNIRLSKNRVESKKFKNGKTSINQKLNDTLCKKPKQNDPVCNLTLPIESQKKINNKKPKSKTESEKIRIQEDIDNAKIIIENLENDDRQLKLGKSFVPHPFNYKNGIIPIYEWYVSKGYKAIRFATQIINESYNEEGKYIGIRGYKYSVLKDCEQLYEYIKYLKETKGVANVYDLMYNSLSETTDTIFMIDMEVEDDDIENWDKFEDIAECLVEQTTIELNIKSSEMILFEGTRPGKKSFHIILPDLYSNLSEAINIKKYLFGKVKEVYPSICKKGVIDEGIYTTDRPMRTLWSAKYNENAYVYPKSLYPLKYIKNYQLGDYILNTKYDEGLELFKASLCSYVDYKKGGRITIDDLDHIIENKKSVSLKPIGSGDDEADMCNIILEQLNLNAKYYKNLPLYPGVFRSYYVDHESRHTNLNCPVCEREHEGNNGYLNVKENGNILYFCPSMKDENGKTSNNVAFYKGTIKLGNVKELELDERGKYLFKEILEGDELGKRFARGEFIINGGLLQSNNIIPIIPRENTVISNNKIINDNNVKSDILDSIYNFDEPSLFKEIKKYVMYNSDDDKSINDNIKYIDGKYIYYPGDEAYEYPDKDEERMEKDEYKEFMKDAWFLQSLVPSGRLYADILNHELIKPNIHIEHKRYIDDKYLYQDLKTVIVNSAMETGKTTALVKVVINWLKQDPLNKVIMTTFRRKLGHFFIGKLNDALKKEGLKDRCVYDDEGISKLNDSRVQLYQSESTLKMMSVKNLNLEKVLLITDECTSYCTQIVSKDTHKKNFKKNFNVLSILFKYVNRFIGFDADIDNRIFELTLNLRSGPINFYVNKFNPISEKLNDNGEIISKPLEERDTFVIHESDNSVINIGTQKLIEGKKVGAFFHQRSACKSTYDKWTKLGFKGLIYTSSEKDDDTIESLLDINKSWSEYDFVIFNTSIGAGLSYDHNYFDIMLFIGARQIVINICTRASFQGITRIRKTLSREIHSFLPKGDTTSIFSNYVDRERIYDDTHLLIDKKCELFRDNIFNEDMEMIYENKMIKQTFKKNYINDLIIDNYVENNISNAYFDMEFVRRITSRGYNLKYEHTEDKFDDIKQEKNTFKNITKENEYEIYQKLEIMKDSLDEIVKCIINGKEVIICNGEIITYRNPTDKLKSYTEFQRPHTYILKQLEKIKNSKDNLIQYYQWKVKFDKFCNLPSSDENYGYFVYNYRRYKTIFKNIRTEKYNLKVKDIIAKDIVKNKKDPFKHNTSLMLNIIKKFNIILGIDKSWASQIEYDNIEGFDNKITSFIDKNIDEIAIAFGIDKRQTYSLKKSEDKSNFNMYKNIINKIYSEWSGTRLKRLTCSHGVATYKLISKYEYIIGNIKRNHTQNDEKSNIISNHWEQNQRGINKIETEKKEIGSQLRIKIKNKNIVVEENNISKPKTKLTLKLKK